MNKIAIVSGATGDIGKAILIDLTQNGVFVVGLYNKNASQATLLKNQYNCDMFQMDIADGKSVENTINEIYNKYHKIDILINNAGVSQQKLFTDLTENEISQMLDVNLKGAMLLTKAVIPNMVREKYGRIINISSIWGVYGGSCETHYSATKAGLIGFTKALSRELGLSGISVNCVAPGLIQTKMNDNLSCQDRNSFIDCVSLQRIGRPEEVAYLVSFLASDKAAYITGQIIGIDGGF